jgi:tRNA(fMet)-specific endonuclease VapC
MLYMLDTDIASYVIKGRSPEIEARLSAIEPSQGMRVRDDARRIGLWVDASSAAQSPITYRSPAVSENCSGSPLGRRSRGFLAEIWRQIAIAGQPIGEMDMLIAAHSLAVAAVLVTNNRRHSERIPAPLILQNWSEKGAP